MKKITLAFGCMIMIVITVNKINAQPYSQFKLTGKSVTVYTTADKNRF